MYIVLQISECLIRRPVYVRLHQANLFYTLTAANGVNFILFADELLFTCLEKMKHK